MNKKIIILIIATNIVMFGFIGAYLLTNSSNDIETTQDSDPLAPVEQPVSEGLAPPAREESFNYTDAVISPSTIANDPDAYIGKTVSTRGWVAEISPDEYVLLSINSDESYVLRIATNENIDFKTYADNSLDPLKESKPVNLTGELAVSEATNSPVFLVATLIE